MVFKRGLNHWYRFVQITLPVFAFLALATTVLASGSDFVVGQFSIASLNIINARDYWIKLRTTSLSNVPLWSGSHTNGWIGINLDNQPGTFGNKFTQVGILTGNTNPRWFVYSEAGVTCLRGQPFLATRGCLGNVGDLVGLNSWHWVEMVYYPGQPYWVVRVYNSSNVSSDVALVHSTSLIIHRAYSAMENAYVETTDPYYLGKYEFSHPQWMFPFAGFQDWPKSDNTYNSHIYSTPSGICPTHYGATPNLNNDEYAWFAGSGGQICNWLLFPSQHHYLPLIIK